MTAANVLVEQQGATRIVTLNRPERRNAIDMPLRVELAEALEAADGDAAVRCIVITGAEGTFCSGGDIATMQPLPRPEAIVRAQAAQRVIRAIWGTRKPVVAAVEGAAYGAGAALALACDRVVSSSEATYATTFTGVGLAGDLGIYVSLPARIGPARAKQMLMMPEAVTGQQAHALGLVDVVTEAGGALTRALDDAQRLAAGPAEALAVIKQMFSGEPRSPHAVLELEVQNQAALFGSRDFAEGAAAFREKRRPVFGRAADVETERS